MPFPIVSSKWRSWVRATKADRLDTALFSYSGDSGVGKTSFIQRFCTNSFTEAFSATIGVDLQIKMLNINNRIIALQLWDTVRLFLRVIIRDVPSILSGWSRKVRFFHRRPSFTIARSRPPV